MPSTSRSEEHTSELQSLRHLVCRLLLQKNGFSNNRVQGLLAPGHVCAVMGYTEYEELARDFRVPFVVGGFEPLDLLEAILMLVRQLEQGRAEVENQYVRSVTREGNTAARQRMFEVFEIGDRKWRGIGEIPASGYRLRPEYAAFYAQRRFNVQTTRVEEAAECIARGLDVE